MRSNPSGLTRLEIDVPNASAEVVAALHGLVAQTTTLVDLNAMEKDGPNLNVLQLNGTEHVESMDLGSKNLGPVSVAIIAACIQRNRVLESLKCAAALPCRVFAFPSAPIDTPPSLGSLADNQLCGLDRWGSSTYTAEGITKLCEGLKGSSVTSLECAARRAAPTKVFGFVSAPTDTKANT